ncbi:sigma-70 family RNA polymerase sigma factor [Maritalea porphyrae]|jgi:RNA polymerase sigma factor (sigma-70 family)|uniref:sigma-70 family RNA polymerase sigma factor n=1 Tax=Maritalea porphyrae TaxID=880732 RepID=UPI0022AF8A9E|nr:sigma-70 family RNA polymerase sigma factor [Maritalea porphyrae]MCZ4271669.1 sigma-70 family RNA polymerase sigma factor [Maritalea porphyrae]
MTQKTDIFEDARPKLMGLAYRLLGSFSDAQDIVQDTYVKWLAHKGDLDTPMAWLNRVCTNACLDQLKSAHRSRVDYVGSWIPDHIQTEFVQSADEQSEFASTLSTAFLLLLERLTPKERASYLLHDIFAMPFDEIADILNLQPAACRKMASRARRFVSESNTRHLPSVKRQQELLAAFQTALSTGDTTQLSSMLRDDSKLRADSGGEVDAVRQVIEGQKEIGTFVESVLQKAWNNMQIDVVFINDALGLTIHDGPTLHATVSFGYDLNGSANQVFIMRHPNKLREFQRSGTMKICSFVPESGA